MISRQKLSRDKTAYIYILEYKFTFLYFNYFNRDGVLFGVLGVLFSVLGVLFGVPGVLVSILDVWWFV